MLSRGWTLQGGEVRSTKMPRKWGYFSAGVPQGHLHLKLPAESIDFLQSLQHSRSRSADALPPVCPARRRRQVGGPCTCPGSCHHALTHAHSHTCRLTLINMLTQAWLHTFTLTCSYTCMVVFRHSPTYSFTHTFIHALTWSHTCLQLHIHTRAYTLKHAPLAHV